MMKNTLFMFGSLAILLAGFLPVQAQKSGNDSLKLWYEKPATSWQKEALPIGNGRLGAMLFGGVERERIQFNEESLWIGDEESTGAYQSFGNVIVTLGTNAAFVREVARLRGAHHDRKPLDPGMGGAVHELPERLGERAAALATSCRSCSHSFAVTKFRV